MSKKHALYNNLVTSLNILKKFKIINFHVKYKKKVFGAYVECLEMSWTPFEALHWILDVKAFAFSSSLAFLKPLTLS